MARYKGPKAKISRRFREPILGAVKILKKKNYPPGQHGKSRKKKTAYALQLHEKQKAKYIYGVLEKQFRNTFQKAVRKKGITGTILLQLLEKRLDNTVYRLGIASTRRAARQLVVHRHITVNERIVNIPSYLLKEGDIIAVKDKSKSLTIVQESIAANHNRYDWLEWDKTSMKGKMIAIPQREQIPEKINEQSIVEIYSR